MKNATEGEWDADVSRSISRQAEVATDTTWLFVYSCSLFFSFLATLLATYHMRKLSGDVFRSTVHFVTTSFLVCTSLHALAAGFFYSILIASMDSWIDGLDKFVRDRNNRYSGMNAGPGSNPYYSMPDAPTLDEMFSGSASGMLDGAIKSILTPDDKRDGGEAAFLTKLTHEHKPLSHTLTMFLVLENIFFVLGAYWIFLLTWELYKLAKITHDRGGASERRMIQRYACGATMILMGFFFAGLAIVIMHKGYNNAYRFLSMFELCTIIISVIFSAGALLKLRFKGRKNEHIHGMMMASPLYRRLKLMMIVCIVFTLPYYILQVSLLGMNGDEVDNVPDYLVGVVTTLYYLFGAAQAIVMGGSQQCCFRILYPIIPAHVRNAPEWSALRSTRRHEAGAAHEITEPPVRPVFVNTDIESSSALWAQAPQHVIDAAQRIHDDLMRSTLPKFHGYEITTAGDAFQLAFHNTEEAVGYCLEVQLQLLQAKWPSELEGLLPSTKTEREFGLKCNAIFKGLRVRMGIHDTETEEGSLISQVHPVTGKTIYIGASELIGREISDVGFGGQIIVSKRIASWLRANEQKTKTPFVLNYYGAREICALDLQVELYEVTPKMIEARRKIFKKRRVEEDRLQPHCSKAASTSVTESSGDSTEDSTSEFRAQQTPTDVKPNAWSIA